MSEDTDGNAVDTSRCIVGLHVELGVLVWKRHALMTWLRGKARRSGFVVCYAGSMLRAHCSALYLNESVCDS